MGNPVKAITKAVSPVVKIATAGTVDISKGRINVPGSSAQFRALASGATLGLADKVINSKTGKTAANLASTGVLATGGLIVGGPAGAAAGAGLATQMWDKKPSLGTALGIAAAAGAAGSLPSLLNMFSGPSPGSGYASSPNYGPVAVPVPVNYQDPAQSPISPPSGQNQQLILIAGGAIVLILLLKR